MQELIAVNPSHVSGQEIPTVNARDLHKFLESKKDFSSWVKDRIRKYGFTEGVDFIAITGSPKKGNGDFNPTPAIDYHLTLDMAKELSMVERNDKGKQARQYFLACERKALASVQPASQFAIPETLSEALRLAADAIDHNKRLEQQIIADRPKVQALDRISSADGMENITNTAKALQVRPKDLFGYLSANRWIYRRQGGKGWIAYQERIQQGVLTHKVTTIQASDGTERMVESVLVTPKGVAKLAQVFSVEEVAA